MRQAIEASAGASEAAPSSPSSSTAEDLPEEAEEHFSTPDAQVPATPEDPAKASAPLPRPAVPPLNLGAALATKSTLKQLTTVCHMAHLCTVCDMQTAALRLRL